MTSDPVERYLLHAARLGRAARLRPMNTAEMFDLGFRVYRALGWTILRHAALPSVFSLAALAFTIYYVLPGFGWTEHGASDVRQVQDAAMLLAAGIGFAAPLFLFGIGLVTSFVAPLVADFLLGHVPNAEAARQAQRRNAGRMVLVSLWEGVWSLSGALVGGAFLVASWALDRALPQENAFASVVLIAGMLALGVGAIIPLWVVSVHALAVPVAALEGAGPLQAARRSRWLMKGTRSSGYDAIWTCYMFLALLGAAIGAGAGTFASILAMSDWSSLIELRELKPLLEGVLQLLPWYLILWICVPLWAVMATILYFERRVRLEGYDIEALAADVWRTSREGRFQL